MLSGTSASKARLFRTLRDIGPRRLQRRVRYELRHRCDRRLPSFVSGWLAGVNNELPRWSLSLQGLEAAELGGSPQSLIQPSSIQFLFLNQPRDLLWPICWKDADWPRLWQFHLHYFDWAREWLEIALESGCWPDEASSLGLLIDEWIAANPCGKGDGWHSYTLSLRIRNWIWLFRCAPQLVSSERLQSLWQQLCWLQAHPESCHGGNHWLENLLALSVGSLQFVGARAEAMHLRSLQLLKGELRSQVLADGGHEERSVAYHLLMLDRLVELGCVLTATRGSSPDWLNQSIDAMASWASVVRLEGGHLPRFNDTAEDAAPALDEVVAFSHAFRSQTSADALFGGWSCSGLRRKLLKAGVTSEQGAAVSVPLQPIFHAVINDLPDTGWTFLRPGHGWELVFKCGVPCPPHLPAHVHSDQLSFELIHRGRWVFSEAGTSIYGNGPQRAFERSGAAHNQLQLGVPNASTGDVDWFEPVEVWGGFRAGRKSQPRQRDCGDLPHGGCFVSGAHDGFDAIGASHIRRIEIREASANHLSLTVLDTVKTKAPLHVRQWWHLAPDLQKSLLEGLIFDFSKADQIHADWTTTTFAQGFGKRVPRHSFCLRGLLPPGEHRLRVGLPVSAPNPSVPI